ncbi:MAG TPA: TonB-dependent copper receptor [Opitutaceae bacterium]|nr:TonB-dependent copper receptor [Opitutaceae bacterium]
MPFSISLRPGLVAGLVLLSATAAPAADDIVPLSPVVVTAPPGERPLTVVLDPKAAAQPIPANDGADVLRAVPGVSVIRKGGTDGDPTLRGMAGSRLGILVDGESIFGGCGNRMDPPTAYVFPDAYDRVTVLKGPESVRYGPGNSAGVVLFDRTAPRFAAAGAELDTALTAGSFGRNDEFVEARAGNPRGYVEAAGTRTESGDYDDGAGRAVPSSYRRWSVHGAAGWTPDATTALELSGLASDGRAAYADRTMDGVKFARRNLGLRLRRSGLSPAVASLDASVYLNAVDHVMDNYSLRPFTPTAMMPGHSVSNPDRLTYGGRFELGLAPTADTSVVAGIDYQANRHRLRTTADEITDPYEVKRRTPDARFGVAGVFAEATRLLGPARRLVAGARADFWSVRDERTVVALGLMGSAPDPTSGRRRDPVLGSGFVRYEQDLRPATTAYVGVGHAERFPDYWELFSKETATSVSAFGVRPEQTTQLDVGLTHRSGPVTASLSLFANRVTDFILIQSGVVKPAAMGRTRTATISRNVDAASRGAEASVTCAWGSGWRTDLSLSGVYGENRTEHRPLAQQPPWESRLGLGYSTARWSAGAVGRFVLAQTRYALNEGNIVGQDLGPTGGYAVFALNAAWRFATHAQVTAGVDNLFGRTYAESLNRGGVTIGGFPPPTLRINEPGRTVWAKLQVTY